MNQDLYNYILRSAYRQFTTTVNHKTHYYNRSLEKITIFWPNSWKSKYIQTTRKVPNPVSPAGRSRSPTNIGPYPWLISNQSLVLQAKSNSSILIQQWLSLAITFGVCHATEQRVTSIVLGAGEIHRFHQEDGEDDKSKDPLQGNDLDGELLYSQG